jgi:hypothetical protein
MTDSIFGKKPLWTRELIIDNDNHFHHNHEPWQIGLSEKQYDYIMNSHKQEWR